MASETLGRIMNFWTGGDISASKHIDFPFNVEMFCAEMDAELLALRQVADAAEKVMTESPSVYMPGLIDALSNLKKARGENV